MSFPATDLLRSEHRTMERLLERFERELGDPQGEGLLELARTFAEIQEHLAGHFAKEEEVFYPALAPALGVTDTTMTRLNDDHADVRETSSAFRMLLEQAPPGSELPVSLRAELSSLGWQLWNLIHHHIDEEEHGLLAFADRSLAAEAQTRLAAQMMRRGEPDHENR
jgi:hemerythrin-like domain-containing protein